MRRSGRLPEAPVVMCAASRGVQRLDVRRAASRAPRHQRRERRVAGRAGRRHVSTDRRRRDVDQAHRRRPTASTSVTSTPSTSDTAYVLSIGERRDVAHLQDDRRRRDCGPCSSLNDDPKVFLDAMTFWDATHGIAISDSIDGQLRDLHDRTTARRGPACPTIALPPALDQRRLLRRERHEHRRARHRRHLDRHGRGRRRRACCARRIAARTWTIADTPLAVRRRRRGSTRSRSATPGTASSSAATTTRSPRPSTTSR